MPKCDSFTKYIPATFAWVLLLGTTSLFFYFPCRDYLPDYPWIPAYQGVITLFVIANFTLATFMDPGVIPRASPEEDREDDFRAPLYKNVEINGITVRMKWCVTCQFYRPPRCSHCSVCNVCIETFDHHCPWVNNCIGRRNYRFFFMFLISLSLHMTSIFTLCLVYVLRHKDELTKVETIVAMVLMGIILLLVIPIYGLTGFHMVLVSRGRTTNEQVTGKFKGGYNPFSRGCSRNCCYILCGPQYPSLLNASKYVGKPKRYPLSASAISTITSENQVKTYMDNSNGVRNASSNAYNKSNSPESSRRAARSDVSVSPSHKLTSTEASFDRGRRAQTLREKGTSTIRTSYPEHPEYPEHPGAHSAARLAAEAAEALPAKPPMHSIQVQTSSEEVALDRPRPHEPHPRSHPRQQPPRPQRQEAAADRGASASAGGGGRGRPRIPEITFTHPTLPSLPTLPTLSPRRESQASDGSVDKWVADYSERVRPEYGGRTREAREPDVRKKVEASKVIQFPLSEEIHHKFAWLPNKESIHQKVMQSDHG